MGRVQSSQEYRKGLLRCQPALCLALALGLASFSQARERQMPPADTLEVAACVLLKAEEAPLKGGPTAFRLDSKKAPKSVKPFLKVSGLIDFRHPLIQKTARKILKRVRSTGQGDKDPEALLKGVEWWVGENLVESPENTLNAEACGDWRKCWPKASQILKNGKADAVGRSRVSLALLRALGVPARPCRVAGGPRVQAWLQFKTPVRPRRSKAAKGVKTPLGRWAVAGGLKDGEAVEAYSFESSELACLRWAPDQDLYVRDLGAGRAYYALSESAQAEADYKVLTFTGALPDSCQGRTLPPAGEGGGTREFLVLSVQRYALHAEGPMDPLNELEALVPYVPLLKGWGSEEPPKVRRLETFQEMQALWTDRPLRLRNGSEGVHDEWKSPPPVLGTQHYLSAYFRRPADILEASFQGLTLTGLVVRSDSLQKREGVKVEVEYLRVTSTPKILLSPQASGRFETYLPLSATGRAALRVRAVQERDGDTLVKDELVLDGEP